MIAYRVSLNIEIPRSELVKAVKEKYFIDWEDSWRGYQEASIQRGKLSEEARNTLQLFWKKLHHNRNYLVGFVLQDFCNNGWLPEGQYRVVEK